jgi:hypothetical protein
MGNPPGIALFSFMADPKSGESRLKVLALAGVVAAIVILGSMAVVRFANRNRQLTPAVVAAAHSLSTVPDSLVALQPQDFSKRRDDFAQKLIAGALPADSVRAFYQSYARWMRDGRWDTADVVELGRYVGIEPFP